MAFNFNWTPLSTTSSEFYTRAKDLLTAALNKAPKPPIIVDDIIVEELNLGSTAPELEILEIGDLAEDRFRGIFKVSYGGDAELTLKTKVQANPLSTYLSTTPSFTSPCPLAASAPLTIPLQITLSQFRLSGFVILVFSKAKGITLVFRNDPLESLRVSSTFDSIPFIKDYLQKEIERVVRGLFQEELPVGIHRLSLKWFNPEYAASLEAESNAAGVSIQNTAHGGHSSSGEPDDEATASPYINPLAPSPEEPNEPQFSQKHMEQLETLFSSQKTLSVVSPAVKEVVFRAWAAPSAVPAWSNGGLGWTEPPGTPAGGGTTTYTFNDSGDAISVNGGHGRPSLSSNSSSMSVPSLSTGSGSSVAAGRLGRGRKKKHRIVNLRKKTGAETADSSSVASESITDLTGSTAPTSVYSDDYASTGDGSMDGSVVMEEDELAEQHYQAQTRSGAACMRRSGSLLSPPSINPHLAAPPMMRDISVDSTGPSSRAHSMNPSPVPSTTSSGVHRISRDTVPATPSKDSPAHECRCRLHPHSAHEQPPMSLPPNPWLNLASMVGNGSLSGSILEQAVLMKLAGEVARLQAREKERESEKERERGRHMLDPEAPPAYKA
ncbi:hypothetical protein BDZ91DRAFT_724795 [Kalaharituber pfeilii]|nr:hypothetical protein BDZ91DRAFT_724795 [Kalaharituber pfeilii]